MKLLIKFYAKQKDGKLIVSDGALFREQLKKFGDREIAITIKPYFNNRSNQENRYYWKCVVAPIAAEMGLLELEQAHEFLKSMFLKEKVFITIKGKMKEVDIPISSATITTVEFEEYLSKCRAWASECLGMYIGLPNEVEAY